MIRDLQKNSYQGMKIITTTTTTTKLAKTFVAAMMISSFSSISFTGCKKAWAFLSSSGSQYVPKKQRKRNYYFCKHIINGCNYFIWAFSVEMIITTIKTRIKVVIKHFQENKNVFML